jgi:hypothetical protein
MRPTYRVLNKHLTIMGCDRQLAISAIFIGGGFLMALGSVVTGLVVFGCFAGLGYLKAKDPVGMRLLLNPGKFAAHYDAAVSDPFVLIIAGRKPQNEN